MTRTVASKTPMVAFDGGQYSVPAHLLGQVVWVRVHGLDADEQVIIVHVGPAGPVEVARHGRATPGRPRLDDAHFPPPPAGALGRIPKARNESEAAFLVLGDGTRLWLTEAAAAGTTKVRVKMAQAVSLAKLFSAAEVDWALGHAAVHARFGLGDLAAILDHQAGSASVNQPRTKRRIVNLPSGFRSLFQSIDRRFQPDGEVPAVQQRSTAAGPFLSDSKGLLVHLSPAQRPLATPSLVVRDQTAFP